ncbi:hypothetical protein FOA52_006192 [Chlamydomonas sp. UWO 241]|nr:hypothetical protein FOA52_006192 [Chlamydomonas sp. UWO 241]
MEPPSGAYDYLFKILLVGDSGVGKSCILTRFTSDTFTDNTCSTIGVDFRVKHLVAGGKRCKLSVWDTAGQERFRTLTSSYYRGAQGIIFVYDATRRETFDNLDLVWMHEVELYGNVAGAMHMVVANKVDLDGQRQVSAEEGEAFAARHGALFVETSAKANVAIELAFEELVLNILNTPTLLRSTNTAAGDIKLQGPSHSYAGSACWC